MGCFIGLGQGLTFLTLIAVIHLSSADLSLSNESALVEREVALVVGDCNS